MDRWILILIAISLSAILYISLKYNNNKRLPPGPPLLKIIPKLVWLANSISNVESLLRSLHVSYGPIVTLRVGPSISIFISDPGLAHQALVHRGIVFADRPSPDSVRRLLSNDRHTITTAPYGPLCRLLRRSLASVALHSSSSSARSWALRVLLSKLRAVPIGAPTAVMDSFQYTMFCLVALMCFGERMGEEEVKAIERAQRDLLLYGRKLNLFCFFPALVGRFLFSGRWNCVLAKRLRQKELYVPLIRSRREAKKMRKENEIAVYSYVDSLLEVRILDEGGRELTDEEIVALCSEFLSAGTETTATALQWIMAELVLHQQVQQKLFDEIEQVMANYSCREVEEKHLNDMSYLKAVVLEGLRRHPPGHSVLPHAVTEDVAIGDYVIPRNASVNFMVAEIGTSEEVWEKPLEFKPERFMASGEGNGVDIMGVKEIKMMPFGVGRRICPAVGIAMLHLKYFVANLVREFEWKGVDGEEVDLAEKTEFTVVMKNPLKARAIPRGSRWL